MFVKKQICSTCKVGKKSYEIDEHSAMCPYISNLEKGKCRFYKPIDRKTRKLLAEKKK